MVEIHSLTKTTFKTIHQTFAEAFSDYAEPFDKTEQELVYMLERRGFDPGLSFGAFDGNKLVGFILNGVGTWNGLATAYDTGTGIIKEYRKQKITTRILETSLPLLKQNGISQYLLEVIQTNTKAFNLYSKAGFKINRKLDYFITPQDQVMIRNEKLNNDCHIKAIESPHWEHLRNFWDFSPSWQNSVDAIRRKPESFLILGAFEHEELKGYGVIEKHTGDIPQLAIAASSRRQGLATTLFFHLITSTASSVIQVINTDTEEIAFRSFADSLHLKPGYGQYEMLLGL